MIFVVIAAGFYFLIYRPQQRKAKAAREQTKAFDVGDEVLTAGGIVGHIIDIDGDRVTLETSVGASFVVLKQYVLRKLEPVVPDRRRVRRGRRADDEQDEDDEPTRTTSDGPTTTPMTSTRRRRPEDDDDERTPASRRPSRTEAAARDGNRRARRRGGGAKADGGRRPRWPDGPPII